MAIEEVSLYEDIIRLSSGLEYGTRKVFECTLIVNDFQLRAMVVNSLTLNRDYRDSYGDNLIIEVMVSMGTYMHKIFPQRQRLRVQLKTTVMDCRGDIIDPDRAVSVDYYRATILDSKDPAVVDQSEESENIVYGDISNLEVVSLQLTDSILETTRQSSIQAIVRNSNLDSLIKALLRGDIFVSDNIEKVNGVIMTPSDNEIIYKQIILPPTSNIIDIIDWIQDYYGIYNNGLGVYLQSNFWYVFPLLQTEKFKEDDMSVTIVILPASKMPGSEKTFDFKDNHLVILGTGERDQIDNTDAEQRNVGNGVRYIDGDRVIDHYSTTTAGKTTIVKEDNILEYRSAERADGLNYIPFLDKIASVNHRSILSKLATTRENKITVSWENSEPNLLLPGMSVRYLYRENDVIKSITGVLINVLRRYAAIGEGILEEVQSSMSTLTILAQSEILEDG